MIVLVTGPEASGTKMVARMLTESGAEVLHRPVPTTRRGVYPHYTGGREEVVEVWGNLFFQPWDVGLVVVRDWFCTLEAQEAAGHKAGSWDREDRLRAGLAMLLMHLQAASRPWRLVTFESLARPEAVERLCEALGLDPVRVVTRWHDANAKYYGGPEWSDRTPLWKKPKEEACP